MCSKSTDSFPILIRSCWFGLNKIFRNKLRSLSLTPVQFTILRCLNENGENGISQELLSTMIFSNKNNTSSILKRMEKMGYITREQNRTDQREKIISCTNKGKNVFKLAECEATDVRQETIENLTSEEMVSVCNSLEKINSKLKSLKS